MKKLTKEQAEWLIETARLHADSNTQRWEQVFSMDRLQAIIDKCTEKQFPYFRMESGDQGSVELNGSIHKGSHVMLGMSFKGVNGAVACLDLNHDEFERFTTACQEVVEWMNEQWKT